MREQTAISWSGGKDASFALYQYSNHYNTTIDKLLTNFSSEYRRVSMHGVHESLMEAQAKSIGITLEKVFLPTNPTMADYESSMLDTFKELKEQGINQMIFGDIFLEDLKLYREKLLKPSGIHPIFPLWQQNTTDLIYEFIELGFKAMIICLNNNLLGEEFAGRVIDKKLIEDLPSNIDPCGENGEFHTFVFDGPIFKYPLPIQIGPSTKRIYPSPKQGESGVPFLFTEISLSQHV